MSKEIELTKGYKAIVDDEDYEWLNKYNWCTNTSSISDNVYAIRMENQEIVFMHKQILGITDGQVDHKDRDTLNNRKDNLRPCTQKQNLTNRPAFKGKKYSNYKGVYWDNKQNRFYSMLCFTDDSGEYQQLYLGAFDTEEEAAIAFNKKAKEVHGEFAYLNDV